MTDPSASRPRRRRSAIPLVIAGAAVLGAALGVGGTLALTASDPTESEEYRALEAELAESVATINEQAAAYEDLEGLLIEAEEAAALVEDGEVATVPSPDEQAPADPNNLSLEMIRALVPTVSVLSDSEVAEIADAVCQWQAADPVNGTVDAVIYLAGRGFTEDEAAVMVVAGTEWRCPDLG